MSVIHCHRAPGSLLRWCQPSWAVTFEVSVSDGHLYRFEKIYEFGAEVVNAVNGGLSGLGGGSRSLFDNVSVALDSDPVALGETLDAGPAAVLDRVLRAGRTPACVLSVAADRPAVDVGVHTPRSEWGQNRTRRKADGLICFLEPATARPCRSRFHVRSGRRLSQRRNCGRTDHA